ncbi:hypothetical protein SRABI27_03453 [Pedobacter sp. Bi27]|uniref:hypothetical protein n=2 Tax=Sphingobacteriaceae TaxID=84566 RepID=UPI001DAB68F5|nr:hypothetical protein [Pedobacter sp. Bi27]CAH0155905.1 hypothetical protein SRABI36_00911 [Pedobacter sp. Bi36]CAH0212187.1 hypothetical protein SRABI126_02003 [Pedobacter sp. Bi126]CAH0269626.1 hypothetical protein SRABI27_03453 [Pedobacter sp. Bi27]
MSRIKMLHETTICNNRYRKLSKTFNELRMLINKIRKNMGILKTAIIGAAVYAGVKYITKKDPITGQSIVDELLDKAPGWVDKAKGYTEDLKNRASNAAEDLAR